MATIYFADGTTQECESTWKSDVLAVIGEDDIEEIDDITCYSLDAEEQALVDAHPDAQFYQAFDDVCGTWKQPLYIFAVEDKKNTTYENK